MCWAGAASLELGEKGNATEVDFDGMSYDSHGRMSVGDKAGHGDDIEGWEHNVIVIVKEAETFPSEI